MSPRAGLDAELFLAGEDPVHGPAHAVEQAGRGGERDEVETGCRLGARERAEVARRELKPRGEALSRRRALRGGDETDDGETDVGLLLEIPDVPVRDERA